MDNSVHRVPDKNTLYNQLLEVCSIDRDRALITMQFEGGFDPEIIMMLRWGDVVFEENAIIVTTKGVIPRRYYLLLSYQFLRQLYDDSTNRYGCLSDDDPVFTSWHRSPLHAKIIFDIYLRLHSKLKKQGLDYPFYIIQKYFQPSVDAMQDSFWVSILTECEDAIEKNPSDNPNLCPNCKTVNEEYFSCCKVCGKRLPMKWKKSIIDRNTSRLFGQDRTKCNGLRYLDEKGIFLDRKILVTEDSIDSIIDGEVRMKMLLLISIGDVLLEKDLVNRSFSNQ